MEALPVGEGQTDDRRFCPENATRPLPDPLNPSEAWPSGQSERTLHQDWNPLVIPLPTTYDMIVERSIAKP